LAELGYHVTAAAASGAQALREVRKTNPDVILMDIHIEGDFDGIETAKLIPFETRPPVIYLTAHSDEATLERARSTCPYGFLLKPFTDRELHATMQMVLERCKVDRASREKQEQLRKTTEELVVQCEQLGVALDTARKASRAKSDFLAVMGHELRTPMNAILGFGQLLERQTFGQLNQRQHEYVGRILEAGAHLLSLIEDLLDLGKIEAAKLHITIERVELVPLLARVTALLSPLAATHEIELTIESGDDLPVAADPTRLCQALINLVSNAIRYNRAGGMVLVTHEARSDGWVRITVADNGIGIPPERHHDVFEPFNRLGAEYGIREGTGIGLPISKRLVELMSGSLEFESAAGAGSKFWIDLPVYQTATPSPVRLVRETAPAPLLRDGSLTALYINEHFANFRLMRNIIEGMAGGRLFEATSASLGFELALTLQPDLILLDLDSPTLDSVSMLQRLRAAPETAAIPVAVLSTQLGRITPYTLSAGTTHPLTNPPQLHELFKIIVPIARRRKVAFRMKAPPGSVFRKR
jgi:signal transduction histidine kinase